MTVDQSNTTKSGGINSSSQYLGVKFPQFKQSTKSTKRLGWVKNPKINCEKLRGLPLNEILKIKMKEIGIEESDFLYQQ
jgi:hypothetical protein